MVDTSEVVAAADAMREKRGELIAQPLAQIYVQLARAGLEAADRAREIKRRENCKHERKQGTGSLSQDGSTNMRWHCQDCFKSWETASIGLLGQQSIGP